MRPIRLGPGPDRGHFPLPGPTMTILLQALVGLPSDRAERWREWVRANGAVLAELRVEESDRLRALLPVIATTPELADEFDEAELTALRMATVREELRVRAIRSIAGEVGEALDRADLPYRAFDGVALADAHWPRPDLRHSAGGRIVVPDGRVDIAAETVLADPGFTTGAAPHTDPGGGQRGVAHRTGLTFVVADRSIDGCRRTGGEVPNRPVAALRAASPTAQLCATLVTAATLGSHDSVLWALDAAHMIRRSPIDWAQAEHHLSRHVTAHPVADLLRFLRDRLGVAEIPGQLIDALGRASCRETRPDFEAVAWAARRSGRWHPGRAVWHAPTLVGGARRAAWLVRGRLLRDGSGPSGQATISHNR